MTHLLLISPLGTGTSVPELLLDPCLMEQIHSTSPLGTGTSVPELILVLCFWEQILSTSPLRTGMLVLELIFLACLVEHLLLISPLGTGMLVLELILVLCFGEQIHSTSPLGTGTSVPELILVLCFMTHLPSIRSSALGIQVDSHISFLSALVQSDATLNAVQPWLLLLVQAISLQLTTMHGYPQLLHSWSASCFCCEFGSYFDNVLMLSLSSWSTVSCSSLINLVSVLVP